ncbi:MAG: hypothetical protein CBE33_05165 [Candidatus Pelagibacter sp. TMED273]|nr:MAG: hypothetical protein CBE33_05165 [Candidatus Pelagibacter sp. TMED273]|tara:strand:- start:13770 stop:14147 length:378 start_codon:yes stop_codon:yes gene_type:complete
MQLKNFKLEEFDSPDFKGSGKNMDANFMQLLDRARTEAGIPFKINSGYRTESHNAKVGGKPKTNTSKGSSHMYGLAADIGCTDSVTRQKIITALVKVGFTRAGIAQSFVHVDLDNDKPNAIWLYS